MTTRTLSYAERIHAKLLDGLQTGTFDVEHRFVDTDVAAGYGSSRMPARDALLRLAAEGYLVGTTRGFAVPSLSLDEIRDLCEVRRQLEPRAAASAAANMTDAVRGELSASIGAVRRALADSDLADFDLAAMMRANVVFRNAWLSAVANRSLAGTTARFMDHFMPIRRGTFEDPGHRESYARGLEAIYDALMRGDALRAGDAMMKFMFDAEAAFLAVRAAQLSDAASPCNTTRRRRTNHKGRKT